MTYDLHDLRAGERDRAYVLVHLMKPEVDLARWRGFLEDVAGQCAAGIERGIAVATLGADCLVGLYSWATQPSLEYKKIFTVDNFIAAGALDPEPLFDAMIKQMDARAQALGCGAVQISLPNLYTSTKQHRLLQDSFLDHGFIVADQKLRRSFEPPKAPPQNYGGAPGNHSPDALH